jgi:CheY-like chemotaxis protein
MEILVAEDDAQLRLALQHILNREGHTVTEAADGDIALRKIAEKSFDLVLMDIIMPNREGIETILEIRRRQPRLKIIAMSGGARFHAFDPLKLARDCGANFVIAKPFEPAALREMVRLCQPETTAQKSFP